MSQEDIYDEQISPLMKQIVKICKKNDISMVADFRLDGKCSCFTRLPFDKSILMKMYDAVHRCGEGNSFHIDMFLMWIRRTFDLSDSIFSHLPLGKGKPG